MSNFKLSGKIKVIKPTEVSKSFSKREFVIETQDQYPQLVTFQLTQDKCEILQSFGPGDQVDVSFNLRGREWTSPAGEVKYFNTVEAWRVEKAGKISTPPKPLSTPAQKLSTPANEEDDDLPF
jgi:hypothetical protein